MGKRKGNAYEREVCTLLSKWISKGKSDCALWRSASSGGRATQRGKKGESTTGAAGDISSVDAVGNDLISLLAIEIKRGYSTNTVSDILDKTDKSAVQLYEKWIEQCQISQKNGGTFSWLLIVKRDRRETLCFFPSSFLFACGEVGVGFSGCVMLNMHIPKLKYTHLVGVRLSDFIQRVTPENITEMYGKWKKK